MTRRRRSSYNVLPRGISGKRISLALAAVLVLVIGTYGVRLAFALGHVFHQDPISAAVSALRGGGGSSIDVARQNRKRINIMLYGYGGGGHSGAYLTDSIMLVSIQPEPSGPPKIAEISIPRDWFVPIDLGNGKSRSGRINEAYADGVLGWGRANGSAPDAGASVANPTVQALLGIHIDHWLGVDFQAFQSTVDSVGGVDVNVERSFTDTQYPHGECDQGDCGFKVVHFSAGMQHLDGARALIFSRSRHGDNGEGSDFARSKRQQMIIAALKQKVVSVGGIGNLPDLLNALGDHVRTDLSIGDVEALYGWVKDASSASIEHVSIDDTNFLYECGYPVSCGAAYLYAHDRSYQSLSHFVQNVFVSGPALPENAPVTFYDASGGRNDASGRWANVTGMLGLHATDGGTIPRQIATQVIDESGGKDTQTAKWLGAYFGVPVTVQTRTGVTAAQGPGGVVVVLGSSEERAFTGDPGVGHI